MRHTIEIDPTFINVNGNLMCAKTHEVCQFIDKTTIRCRVTGNLVFIANNKKVSVVFKE